MFCFVLAYTSVLSKEVLHESSKAREYGRLGRREGRRQIAPRQKAGILVNIFVTMATTTVPPTHCSNYRSFAISSDLLGFKLGRNMTCSNFFIPHLIFDTTYSLVLLT